MGERAVQRWAPAPGVVELPDGRRVRGRALRRPPPPGPTPTFGVYLLGQPPAPTAWEARWVPWPDFRLPRERAVALAALTEAYERAARERVEIACGGGIGRTGTALACLGVLAGLPADEAIDVVRRQYHRRAVETPWQRRFVRGFHRLDRPPEP